MANSPRPSNCTDSPSRPSVQHLGGRLGRLDLCGGVAQHDQIHAVRVVACQLGSKIQCVYNYGKCLAFARTRNDDRRRIIIIIRIKLLLKIFNECRSLTGWGELNPY
jgi:hypothetical protein